MPCDLILLDVSLGLKLLEQLTNHEEWQQIHVLLMATLDEMDLVAPGN